MKDRGDRVTVIKPKSTCDQVEKKVSLKEEGGKEKGTDEKVK